MNNKELVENNMQNEEFKKVFSNIKYEILNAQYDIFKGANARTLRLYYTIGKIIEDKKLDNKEQTQENESTIKPIGLSSIPKAQNKKKNIIKEEKHIRKRGKHEKSGCRDDSAFMHCGDFLRLFP